MKQIIFALDKKIGDICQTGSHGLRPVGFDFYSSPFAANQRSASNAAMHPVPAAVMA